MLAKLIAAEACTCRPAHIDFVSSRDKIISYTGRFAHQALSLRVAHHAPFLWFFSSYRLRGKKQNNQSFQKTEQ
jgi:hypothetical protein